MTQKPKLILQINLNRCAAAHYLLEQTACSLGVDVCLVSEPNRALAGSRGWLVDERGDAAIWVVNKAIRVAAFGSNDGAAWVTLQGGETIFSCYFSPNRPIEEFQTFLDSLTGKMTSIRGPLIVAGDFNAKSPQWGAALWDNRGHDLSDWASSAGLVVANEGSEPTFLRTTGQGSVVDVTMYSENVRLEDWRVLVDVETLSDHRYISFRVGASQREAETPVPGNITWRKINEEVFRSRIRLRLGGENGATPEELMRIMREACNEAGTTSRSETDAIKRAPKYWWTREIAEARRWCTKSRRTYARAIALGSNSSEIARQRKLEQLRTARRSLKWLIKKSRERSWRALSDEVETHPWGLGYKLVTGKLKAMSSSLHSRPSEEQQEAAIAKLFPDATQEDSDGSGEKEDIPLPPPVTTEEIIAATSKTGGKAPGPDGIPASVIKVLGKEAPGYLRKVADGILARGRFPVEWKRARVVLIPKPGKPPGDPSSLRPICLLSTVGKVFERIITNRLAKELEEDNLLSEEQYGFRHGRSTLMAIERIISAAEAERQKSLKTRGAVLVILLDISNAFNSMPWKTIKDALRKKGISPYLRRVIENYLSERTITWGAEGKEKPMTVGVPQGSVLGPVLWNIAYDGVLHLKDLPPGTITVAYADDLAVVVRGQTASELEHRAEVALMRVSRWLEQHQLRLAAHKTEALLLKGRKRIRKLAIRLNGEIVAHTKRTAKYLGVILDEGMTFVEHVHAVTARAEKATQNLAKILPRLGGAGESRRRLLATVADSIVLYASPVWGPTALERGGMRTRKKLRRVQRRAALRTARSYRTVSTNAAFVLARAKPWEETIKTHAKKWRERQGRQEDANSDIAPTDEHATEALINDWEAGVTEGAEWTRRLIPDVRGWYGRGHGQMTYHLSQVLSGHGCFQAYLHRFRRASSSLCMLCDSEEDDTAEHAVFRCARFEEQRRQLESSLGATIAPENLMELALRDEAGWQHVARVAEDIMKVRETLERQRERTARVYTNV